jgi:hypothetical protein
MNTLKTFSLRSVFLLGSLAALTTAAHAQSAITKAIVPFEFAAGGAMLPAGEYTIEVPDFSGLIVLRGSTGNSVALLTTFSGGTTMSTSTKLIFERRDGMAYLAAVEWPNERAGVMSPFMHVTKGALAAALH